MTVLLALALIALILMMPLKRVDKVFVAIDKSVGEPVVIRPLTDDALQCKFRSKPISHFGPCRSRVSVQSDQVFRLKPINHFGQVDQEIIS